MYQCTSFTVPRDKRLLNKMETATVTDTYTLCTFCTFCSQLSRMVRMVRTVRTGPYCVTVTQRRRKWGRFDWLNGTDRFGRKG